MSYARDIDIGKYSNPDDTVTKVVEKLTEVVIDLNEQTSDVLTEVTTLRTTAELILGQDVREEE
jgi:hypothetical protein